MSAASAQIRSDVRSGLYFGQVMHSRLRPVKNHFRYRVFSLLLDLDEAPALARRLKLFSRNRFNLFGFHDRDYGEKTRETPRVWAEKQLRAASIPWDGGRIEMLCFPRILGYVFNPLSEYFCYRRDGRLAAIIHEVHNTFGGRQAYVLPVAPGDAERGVIAQACDKEFYVSPFIEMEARYAFRIKAPADHVSVLIRERGAEGEILRATLSGRRRPLTDGQLLKAFFLYPLMTLKVIVAIHWQALRLWRKGAKFHRRTKSSSKRDHRGDTA